MAFFLLLVLIVVNIQVYVTFILYCLKRRIKNLIVFRIVEIIVVLILPLLFLSLEDFGAVNDCCNDSSLFSPGHKAGLYVLMLLSVAVYFYASLRKSPAPPVPEVMVNVILVFGICFNVILIIHIVPMDGGAVLSLAGDVPVILLFILLLMRNQTAISHEVLNTSTSPGTGIRAICEKLLQSDNIIKYPVYLILVFPVLLIVTLILYLFGQKPDTLVRAFTDTYKHGFSQLDFECDNVRCGGHYLCSVAANGHPLIVKPIRFGLRQGGKIICNRQLLVANAFEELLAEKAGRLHAKIRSRYDRVGDVVHQYYYVFEIKWISDLIYILMKPLEWGFLFVLYCFDRNPENRIARQYCFSSGK